MSLLFKRRDLGDSLTQLVPQRSMSAGSVSVSGDSALRHSAVWACLRLRADLISTMPIDVFRKVDGIEVEMTKPAFLTNPAPGVHLTEWLYSSQMDLDRFGNAFGVITARDGSGNPAQVDLLPAADVTVVVRDGMVKGYKYGRETWAPEQVWHEKQFTVAGMPVGLSPVAYAAWSIGGYLSAQQFALQWFSTGAHPSGTLKNSAQTITPALAQEVRERFKVSVANRDVFVTGADWDFTPGVADAAGAAFLDEMKYGVTDVCRFFGVPAEMIDGETSTSMTYANVTQKNLQLLVMNINPALVRREAAFSAALPRPRYVEFNRDALLRMDPMERATVLKTAIEARYLTSDEARALENRPPLTEQDYVNYARLFGQKAQPSPPAPGATQ
jgi:HK97 family phage portal protein